MSTINDNQTSAYYNYGSSSDNKCERCLINQSNFVCEQCEPLKAFCKKCDSLIHTLSTKRNHIRLSLTTNKNINEPEFQNTYNNR